MASTPIPTASHPLDSLYPNAVPLLNKLHALSLSQERAVASRGAHFPNSNTVPAETDFIEQLVALDEDKCRAVYLILRAMGATRVVEAGTSYGISLIWLLAAVQANLTTSTSTLPPLVIGTENEPAKATIALSHVTTSFTTLPPCLTLLQGDLLLLTLPTCLDLTTHGQIDAVLLDIWAPLALATLRILKPYLRKGPVVFVDNSKASEGRYAELLTELREGGSGFESVTLPFEGGLEMAVYTGVRG